MDDKRVTITCDIDQALAAQGVLIGWLNRYESWRQQGGEELYHLVDEFDDAIHAGIWGPDYE